MGSKHNNVVMPKMVDKDKLTKKHRSFYFKKKKKTISEIEITVNGSVIKQVKEKKILGIIVDKKLKFKSHIEYLNTFVQKPGNHMVALQQPPCYLQQIMSKSISPS